MQSADIFAAMAPVVAELERLGVTYYVGGSVAGSAYGQLRTTQDVDLVADLKPAHAELLVNALRNTFYVDLRAVAEAIARHSCFNLIHLATMFKVDVFVVKMRLYDQTALRRRRKQPLLKDDPDTVFFLPSPEDIVLAKLEWFRLGDEVAQQQWRDVVIVLKVQRDAVDRKYLEQWAGELGVADLLAKAWKEAE